MTKASSARLSLPDIPDTRASDDPQRTIIAGPSGQRQRRALVRAGEKLISELGFDPVCVEDIAAAAGLSSDVFHAYFRGKDALLSALCERFVEQMIQTADAATRPGTWQGSRARDVIEVAVRSILDIVIDRRRLVAACLARGTTNRELHAGLRSVGAHLARRVDAVLAECSHVPLRQSRTVAFALLLAVSIVHHHILVGDGWSGVSFSGRELAEETCRAVTAYLRLEPTIAIRQAGPDAASTESIPALRSLRWR